MYGQVIREARKRLSMVQYELAGRAGVNRATVVAREAEKFPPIKNIAALGGALQIRRCVLNAAFCPAISKRW
jgi:DNA-binding XRE family transcriptional regulator